MGVLSKDQVNDLGDQHSEVSFKNRALTSEASSIMGSCRHASCFSDGVPLAVSCNIPGISPCARNELCVERFWGLIG